MHYVVYAQKAELDQIQLGFQVLDFDKLIAANSLLLKPLFIAAGRQLLTAAAILGLFFINWSPQGSNRRDQEEEIILHWNYYVEDLEGEQH